MSFDPKRNLTMASFKTVLGHNLAAGTALIVTDDPTAPAEVDQAMARRLWASGLAVYADDHHATPVESRTDEARRVVTLEHTAGAWWAISAPWMDKPEKVQGEAAATARYNEIVASGRPVEQPSAQEPETAAIPNENKSDMGEAPVPNVGGTDGPRAPVQDTDTLSDGD